jgi:hypothetical protein
MEFLMSHVWEFLMLVGFILMSSELLIHDKKALNERWNRIIVALVYRSTFKRLSGIWVRWARQDAIMPIVIGSWFLWLPLIFLFYADFREPDGLVSLMLNNVGNLTVVLFTNMILLYAASLGLSLLLLHFSERALHTNNATFFGLQVGAYITICAQIRKVIWP